MKNFYVIAIVALLVFSTVIAWSILLSDNGPAHAAIPGIVEEKATTVMKMPDVAPPMLGNVYGTHTAVQPVTAEPPRNVFPGTPVALPPGPAADSMGPPIVADVAVRAVPIEVPPSNEDGLPLPVIFRFAKRPSASRAEKALGGFVIEGALLSTADKPITITVTETSDDSRDLEQTQFSLGAGVQYRFGVRDGLNMTSGDKISIQSPHYRQLDAQTP